MNHWRILHGDVRERLADLEAGSVRCCVTSPPYWQKRDYGCQGQIGTEKHPNQYVDALVAVFADVNRVLTDDGSLFLNLGDSFAAGGNGGGGSLAAKRRNWRSVVGRTGWRKAPNGFKSKDLTLVPFMVAAALRDWGWYLRQQITWHRLVANEPNRLDRPAVSHEFIFLLSKSEDSAVRSPGEPWWSQTAQTVWPIPASQGGDEHPAPMPNELARRCIVAGSRPGDVVLDCFNGRGTTGEEAIRHQRNFVGVELNPAYIELARKRIGSVAPMFAEEVA